VSKTQYFLDRPDMRDAIARAGHARTRAEHTYEKRFAEILEQLRSIGSDRQTRPWTLSVATLDDAVTRYRRKGLAGFMRAALVAPLSLVFGRQRGCARGAAPGL